MRTFVGYVQLLLMLCLIASIPASATESVRPISTLVVTDATAGQVTLFNSETFEIRQTINLPYPLHDKIWQVAGQRHAYLSSPEGWIVKFDLQTGMMLQQLRAGQITSAVALSHDGRYLMVANVLPATLLAIDTDNFALLRTLDIKDKDGKTSVVESIHNAPARQSFIAVMRDIPELWEMSYDPHAEPIYEGYVHDYKMGEGIALRGPFPVRRIVMEQPLAHFVFDAGFTHAIGADKQGLLQVINLNIRRKIREMRFASAVLPDVGGIWQWQNSPVLVLPQADEKILHVIDMHSWQVIRDIALETKHPRLLGHAKSRHVWLENSLPEDLPSTEKRIQLLDKNTLSIVPRLSPLLTSSSAPLAWTDDGRLGLLCANSDHKEMLIVDTETLELVRRFRLP